MRRPAGILIAAAAAALASIVCAASAGAGKGAEGRLLLDDRVVPPDAPVWVCAEGAARPETLHVDGMETGHDGGTPRPFHLAIPWPAHGPLSLLDAAPARPRLDELPFWGHDGYLAPGEYVLGADGFAPETLRVRPPTGAERRARAVLARARLHAEAGDSTLAARLAARLHELEPDGAYDDAAFLALGRLWRFSAFRERPESWLAEWVARHHSRCAVGEGIRVWLGSVPEPLASVALKRTVSHYRDTRASDEAAERLAGRGKSGK